MGISKLIDRFFITHRLGQFQKWGNSASMRQNKKTHVYEKLCLTFTLFVFYFNSGGILDSESECHMFT